MVNFKQKESGFSRRAILKKVTIGLLLTLFILLGGGLIYVNSKKNDITERLLKRVNNGVSGEFTVRSVSLHDIFSYPHLELNLKNVQFWESKRDSFQSRRLVLEVPEANIMADLSELLSKKILINEVELNRAQLFIERDSSGLMIISEAFAPIPSELKDSKENDSTKLQIDISSIRITNSDVIINDSPSETYIPVHLEELIGDFSYREGHIDGKANVMIDPSELIDTLGIPLDTFKIFLRAAYDLDLKRRRIKVESPETDIAHNKYDLKLSHDYSEAQHLKMELNSLKQGIDLEDFFPQKKDSVEAENKLEMRGVTRFRSNLSWRPDSVKSFYESLDISFSLEGKNLMVKGLDLDKIIEKYKRSQNFNLVDIGAVMFTGPAGLAVTKGGDYASMAFINRKDSTEVKRFLAAWRFDQGQLDAADVAMTTTKNRLAMDGWYNAVSDSLMFRFHVIDKKGCQLVGQKMYGPAQKPKYGRISILKTFLGPVKNFFRDIGITKCEVVYTGSIEHPTKQKKQKSDAKTQEVTN